MSPVPFIQCTKCSKPASENDARCGQCGGSLVRVCGDCQFKNSLAKRFCDRCGSRLRPDTIISTKKPPIARSGRPAESKEPQGPQIPGAAMGPGYDPFRGPSGQQGKGSKQQPVYRPSGNSEVSPSRNPTTYASRNSPGRLSSLVSSITDRIEKAKAQSKWGSLLLTLLLSASGMYGAIMIGLQLYRVVTPDAPVLGVARAYLDALSRKDYSSAYDMLTEASKAQATRAEFAKLQQLPDWQYSELNLASLEGSLAVIQYSFKGVWQKAQDELLVLVREKDRWEIDRDQELLSRVEDAFDRRDVGEAYRLSILAAQTHKWDPLAHAYLCEAAYARHQRSEAEMHCHQALDNSAAMPYRLSAATKKHLALVLADLASDDKRYSEAATQYTALLSSSGLLADERCHLLLARSDVSLAASQYNQALKDLQAAGSECKTDDEKSYIARNSAVLDGSAGNDAVALVKKHTINTDGETLLEWSRDKTSDSWESEYLGGTKYKVSLRSQEGTALTALVDLWTGNIDSLTPQNFE